MKIKIKEAGGRGFSVIVPNSLLMSGHAVNFIMKAVHLDKESWYDAKMINEMIKEMKKCVKYHKKENGVFEIIDIKSADGDIVKITF